MQESAPQLAIRVSDLVVGFGKHVVIDHLSLDVRRKARLVREADLVVDTRNATRLHAAGSKATIVRI